MSSIAQSLNILDRGIDMEAQECHTCTRDQVPTFNGIAIPDEILRQLKMLCHTPISRLSRAEIEDAVLGFEGDAEISEDPNGTTLLDKMHLTWDEQMATPTQSWSGYNYWPNQTLDVANEPRPEETKKDSEASVFSFVDRYLNPMHYLPTLSFL